jgi:hypothetical protein
MNQVEFIVDQLRTTFNGDSWHGPNLVKTLDGIDLFDAGTKYLVDRHTASGSLPTTSRTG